MQHDIIHVHIDCNCNWKGGVKDFDTLAFQIILSKPLSLGTAFSWFYNVVKLYISFTAYNNMSPVFALHYGAIHVNLDYMFSFAFEL